jgi:uncharacterized membrane protein
MADTRGVFVYIGTYSSEVIALDDYAVVKGLYSLGAVGSYDAAVVTKDHDGTVHVNQDESGTRHGMWGGLAVGALIGVLFPPSVIASAVVAGAVGGVAGHLSNGLSRADAKELGEFIEAGEACLLVIGESTVEAAIDTAGLKAERHVGRQLDVDAKDVDAAVAETAKLLE